MQVPFRQGIVKSIPNFLQLTGSTVSLVIPQPAYVLFTVADGTSDYLVSETVSVNSAWPGPFNSGVDYWLFWELDPITGVKKYGHTLYEPVESTIAPTVPVNDQHWFDSTAGKMKVWNGVANRWVEKIRIFAARLTNASQLVSMSINSPSFEGTQVGSYLSTQILAGYIVLDDEGKALRKGNGKFFTTEDVGVAGVTHTSRVKFSSIVREAEAAANMANLTVVAFTDFDTIVPATPSMVTQGKLFGIIEEDVIIGGFVNVVFEGVVSSSEWDWTSLGINAPLYIGAGGVLSSTATPPALTPIAVVSGVNSIQFGVPKVVSVGGSIVDVMSTSVQGTGKLSVAAANPVDPVVVGDNDPRMTDARPPTAHTHDVGDVSGLQDILGSISPAFPATEIVFGTGTSSGSSPNMTYNQTTGQLFINTIDGSTTSVTGNGSVDRIAIFAPNSTSDYYGGSVLIQGGVGSLGNGGGVEVMCGSGAQGMYNMTSGGNLKLWAGAAAADFYGDYGQGGNVDIRAGVGGGSVSIRGGNVPTGYYPFTTDEGSVLITSGSTPGGLSSTIELHSRIDVYGSDYIKVAATNVDHYKPDAFMPTKRQFLLSVSTTNDTATPMMLDTLRSTIAMKIADNTSWMYTARVVGRVINSGDAFYSPVSEHIGCAYEIRGFIARDSSSYTVGNPMVTLLYRNVGNYLTPNGLTAWVEVDTVYEDVKVVVKGVDGAFGTYVEWSGEFEVIQSHGAAQTVLPGV